MKTMPDWLAAICRVALMILIPIILPLLNVRLLMTPAFPEIEYRLPGFPPDAYGFTQADRLQWSKVAIDYLLNSAGIEFLGDLRFASGQTAPPDSCVYFTTRDCTYLYNDRELRHMADVKVVTRGALTVLAAAVALALAAGGALFYFGHRAALRAGLLGGAAITAVILLGIVAYLLVNFNTFFVQFHRIFFEGDTWLFLWSDTLIRLFPLRFWQDTFLFVGLGALADAGLIAALAWYRLR